jgi:hypothetical protein
VIEEAIVQEIRSLYSDLAARWNFTKEGEPIKDTRSILYEWDDENEEIIVASSGDNLSAIANDSSFGIEIG